MRLCRGLKAAKRGFQRGSASDGYKSAFRLPTGVEQPIPRAWWAGGSANLTMRVGTTLQEPTVCRTSKVEIAPDSAAFDTKAHKREPKRARDLTCLYP